MKKKRILSIVLILFQSIFLFTLPARGAMVELEGDLGTQTWPGTSPLPLAPGPAVVEPFSLTTATGSVSGDVISTNSGTFVELTLTNFTYTASADGAAPGAHSIELSIAQEFNVGAGPYTATHSITGTADLGAGQNVFAQLMSTHNFTEILPTLSDTASGAGTGLPLAAGPAGQTVNHGVGAGPYVIEKTVFLSFDGGFANPASISLPASATTTVTLIPEPSILGLLAASVLLLVGFHPIVQCT